MEQLPTISSYGQYRSGNYGVNSLQVSFGNGLTLYYSYDTIIAFCGRDGLKVRVNDWSTTTGKHLNWIDGAGKAKANRLEGEEFINLLKQELEYHNLLN